MLQFRIDVIMNLLNIRKRGIYNSQIRVPGFQSNPKLRTFVLERVKEICQTTSVNMKFLQLNEEMRRRTFVVRYEDIAIKPFEYAKRILEFTGLDYTSEVKDWIIENTHGSTGKV